jgi:hypothetical protein
LYIVSATATAIAFGLDRRSDHSDVGKKIAGCAHIGVSASWGTALGAFEQIFGANKQVPHVGGSDKEARWRQMCR